MTKESNTNVHPLHEVNSGARVSAVRLINENPKAAALISKLTTDIRRPTQTDPMQQQGVGLDWAGLRSISQDQMQNLHDAEVAHQMLSDTELASQILVSVILSPKDMIGVEVGYESKLSHWKVPHDTLAAMTSTVREYFEEDYKIKPRLATMLEDILFRRGCWPVAVLPENAIDDLIHSNGSVSQESFNRLNWMDDKGSLRQMNLLGPTDAEKEKAEKATGPNSMYTLKLGLEHLMSYKDNQPAEWNTTLTFEGYDKPAFNKDHRAIEINPLITVTDNFNILKMPAFTKKLREDKLKKILKPTKGLSAESISSKFKSSGDPRQAPTPTQLVGQVFHKSKGANSHVKEIKTQDKLKRKSVGPGLDIHFPSEAVMPVTVPNQPDKQIGFFVLLDVEGNPVNRGQGVNHYRELSLNMYSNSFASSMMNRAGLAMSDTDSQIMRYNNYTAMSRMYGQMLERDLYQRLRNGLIGKGVSIAGSDEIYNLMLARTLSNQQTQILYIPAEYMTYIAFDYHTNGTGKSLLDNTKIIDSMQAMLLIGTTFATLRNAIGRTRADIELDPNAPDAWKQVEVIMDTIHRANSRGFPLGTTDPVDITNSLLASQFEFGITGSPRLPNMKVEFTEKNSNYNAPDTKLIEDFRKRRLMSFSLTPEQVDAAAGSDFATSVANNSTLLSKRAIVWQDLFTPQVSSHLRKHAIHNADLIDRLVDLVLAAYKDILNEYKEGEELEMLTGEIVTRSELNEEGPAKAAFIREVIEDFLGGFSMTLPKPDTTKLNNLKELYSQQSDLIDEALKAYISQDMLDPSIVGEQVANHVGVVFNQIKSYLLRNWQIRHGMLTELSDLTARDDDGKPVLDVSDIAAEHNESMMELIVAMVTANKKQKEKSDKALADVEDSTADMATGSSGGDSSSGGNDGNAGDFGDDFDLGGDFGNMGGENPEGGDAAGEGETKPEGEGEDNADANAAKEEEEKPEGEEKETKPEDDDSTQT